MCALNVFPLQLDATTEFLSWLTIHENHTSGLLHPRISRKVLMLILMDINNAKFSICIMS